MNTEKKNKLLILTGGGDCPGHNAVIRGIAKRARREKDWEVYGSIEAFNGVFRDPVEIVKLNRKMTGGIHVRDCGKAYSLALLDTLVWRSNLSFNDPFVVHYMRYLGFRYFPVVE